MDWGTAAAVSSPIVAAAGIVWNSCLARQHQRHMVRPLLSVTLAYRESDRRGARVYIRNVGFGPAKFTSLHIIYKNRDYSWFSTSAQKQLFEQAPHRIKMDATWIQKGEVLGAGDDLTLFVERRRPVDPNSPTAPQEARANVEIGEWIEDFTIRAGFESAYGEAQPELRYRLSSR